MAAGLGPGGASVALSAIVQAFPHVQLHIGNPGAAGTANPATETTRKTPTWGTPAAGVLANAAQIVWPSIVGSEDATYFSAWSQLVGGTFGFSGTITAGAYAAGDDYVVAVGGATAAFTLAS